MRFPMSFFKVHKSVWKFRTEGYSETGFSHQNRFPTHQAPKKTLKRMVHIVYEITSFFEVKKIRLGYLLHFLKIYSA